MQTGACGCEKKGKGERASKRVKRQRDRERGEGESLAQSLENKREHENLVRGGRLP
jgi:hypothetical protein